MKSMYDVPGPGQAPAKEEWVSVKKVEPEPTVYYLNTAAEPPVLTLKSIAQATTEQALEIAESIGVELGASAVMNRLQELPALLQAAGRNVADGKRHVAAMRNTLQAAKEINDLDELMCIQAAEDGGFINGKNAETRKRQADLALAQDEKFQASRKNVIQAQAGVDRLQQDLDVMEADLSALRDDLRAHLAVAGVMEQLIAATRVTAR